MTDILEIAQSLEIDGAAVTVVRVETREALDEISVLRAEVTDGQNGPEPSAIIGKTLELTLTCKKRDQERKFVGYVVECERTSFESGLQQGTKLVARPRLHRLTQRADCRSFQDMTVVDIVKKVLDGAGVPADA